MRDPAEIFAAHAEELSLIGTAIFQGGDFARNVLDTDPAALNGDLISRVTSRSLLALLVAPVSLAYDQSGTSSWSQVAMQAPVPLAYSLSIARF